MLTKQEAIAKYGEKNVWECNNGDWAYRDDEKWMHLMREINEQWVELTEGIKTKCIGSWPGGDWSYYDEDDWEHLMRQIDGKWVELTKGIKTRDVGSWQNGDWSCENEKDEWHNVKTFDNPKIIIAGSEVEIKPQDMAFEIGATATELILFNSYQDQQSFTRFVFEKLSIDYSFLEKKINAIKELQTKENLTDAEIAVSGTPLLAFSAILNAIKFSPLLLHVLLRICTQYMTEYASLLTSIKIFDKKISNLPTMDLETKRAFFQELQIVRQKNNESMLVEADKNIICQKITVIEKRVSVLIQL
jgi:hypothetical protein